MLAARNLNYGGGSAKHDTGVHFSPVFSACIGQPMMNKTAECKTRVRQRVMWAKKGIITIQKEKKKEKKKRNIARTFKHEDNFHYFLIPRSLAFGAADKREGCHVIFVILFSEPGVNDFKCYLISIAFFILAVSFFSALNDVI